MNVIFYMKKKVRKSEKKFQHFFAPNYSILYGRIRTGSRHGMNKNGKLQSILFFWYL